MKNLLTGLTVVVALGCSPAQASLAPSVVAQKLAEGATGAEKTTLEAAAKSLAAAEKNGTVTDAERDALSSLWASANHDGHITDDERNLLTSLVQDLAATEEQP